MFHPSLPSMNVPQSSIAKVVKNIEPHVRTRNNKIEIRESKDDLAKPRAKLRASVTQAGKTPGID